MQLSIALSVLLCLSFVSSSHDVNGLAKAKTSKISNRTADFVKKLRQHVSNSNGLLEDDVSNGQSSNGKPSNGKPFNGKHSNERIAAEARISAEANDYFDDLFENLGEYVINNGYDPTELQDFEHGFSWKLLLITYHGELKFTKGWLNDIHTIHRKGDSKIKYNNQLLSVRIPVGFETLLFNYDYSAKFMNLGPSGGLDGRVEETEFFLDILVDLKEVEIVLQDFRITKVDKIKLKWTGNVLVDWMANIFTSVTLTLFHGIIVGVINVLVKGNVENLLEQINGDLSIIFG